MRRQAAYNSEEIQHDVLDYPGVTKYTGGIDGTYFAKNDELDNAVYADHPYGPWYHKDDFFH